MTEADNGKGSGKGPSSRCIISPGFRPQPSFRIIIQRDVSSQSSQVRLVQNGADRAQNIGGSRHRIMYSSTAEISAKQGTGARDRNEPDHRPYQSSPPDAGSASARFVGR